MTQLIHRAFLATLATGAVVASGAFGVPAHAAPAPDMYGPTVSQVKTIGEGLGGSVTFKVDDNPGLSSIDLRDPSTDAIFYHRVVDFPGNVTDDGVHHYSFEIKFSDIQAAWTKAATRRPYLRPLSSSRGGATGSLRSALTSRLNPSR